MARTRVGGGVVHPVDIDMLETPQTIHDIDLFTNGQANYQWKDIMPTPEGQTLNWIWPKGATIKVPTGEAGRTFVKQWQWIWNEYDRIVGAISAQFRWEGLPEEMKAWNIENRLNKEGKGAFVKLNGKYIFCNYDVKDWNIYDEPLTIEINHPEKQYDKREYKEGEFVIIKNQPSGQSTFMDIIQYLEGEYATIESLRHNNFTSQPKALVQAGYNEDGTPIVVSLNAIAGGSKTFYEIRLSSLDLRGRKNQAEYSQPDIKDIVIPIEFTDRTELLIKAIQFWQNQINERVGLNINITYEKKERVNTAEVQTQNSASSAILQSKLDVRRTAIDDINKIFGLGIEVDLLENEAMEMAEAQQEAGQTDFTSEKVERKRRVRKVGA